MKRKSLFSILIMILTFVLAFSLLTACNDKTTLDSLKNDYGASIEGGAFPEGATLVTAPIDETSDEGKNALDSIKDQEYNTFKPVYIFDISVVKDNTKVQPNGKIKVTIPVTADLASYNTVLHIKDSGDVEKLSATYADGKMSFETDSFSIFVLVEPAAINHLHTFSDEWSHNETNHWHTATCEHTDVKGDLGEHQWDGGEITTPATEDKDGVITYTCTICGREKTEPVKYHLHTFSDEWSHNETNHWHTATCEHTDIKGDLGEHQWDGGEITMPATEDKDGVITYTCAICGREKTEPVKYHLHTFSDEWSHNETHHWHTATCEHTDVKGDLGEHQWDGGEITTPATEDKDGVITYTCAICGREKTEPVKYHLHTFRGEWSQSETHHWHDCTAEDCDAVSDYEEHYYDSNAWWEIEKEATETEEGIIKRICIGCKYEDRHTIPKYDPNHKHTYSEEWTSNYLYHWHTATCAHVYEHGDEAEHTWDKGVITKPATEEDGMMTYTCTVCGATKNEIIPHTHTFSEAWSKNETHHWHDATCGHTAEIDGKAEHTWNDGEVTTPATEEKDGIKTYACTVCGQTKEEAYEFVPHTHEFSRYWSKDDDYHWHICIGGDGCTEVSDKAEHVWGNPYVMRLPSDIEGGLTIYYCTCNAKKYVTTSHEHEYYSDWRYTDTEHWKVVSCSYSACKGLTSTKTKHEYVDGFCKDCGIKDPSVASEGLEFALQDDGTYFVSGIGTCTDVHLVIPSVHEGKAVTGVSAEAFSYNSKLCSVYLPDSVKTVGDKAFLYCSGIHSIRLPDEMTYIGESAFTSNRLYTLTLPTKGLTEIKKDAFSYNQNLLSLYIPDNIKVIGDETFYYCSNVKELRLPETMDALGVKCFAALKITSVDIPNGIKEIPEHAFYSCPLTEVYIPDGVETIGKYAFSYCQSLTTVRLPESLTSIGMYAFYYCTKIESITIPSKVTVLNEGTFYCCRELSEVILPEGLISIGGDTFALCQKLAEITLPSTLTTIDSCAFQYTVITSIVIPEKVTAIGNAAFQYCKSLASVTLPSGLKSIGRYAFQQCVALTAISIPDGVTDILDGAFSDCTSLATVNLPTSLKELSTGAFSYTIITSVVVPDSVTEMGWNVFYNCKKLESITFGSNSKLKNIGQGAFRGCNSLTSITLPSSIKNVEESAFNDCGNLKYSEYDNAYYLGDFDNPYFVLIQVKDKTATSCTIHPDTCIIAERAFYSSAITEISIHSNVKAIGKEAFKNSDLEKVYFASLDDWSYIYDEEAKTYRRWSDNDDPWMNYWHGHKDADEGTRAYMLRESKASLYWFIAGFLPDYTHASDD